MDNSVQFKKNFIWNILGTGFNAFNSLFFLITVTRINGVTNAGIFTIAFSTACIMYIIGIYAGRIYQVTEQDKNVTNKDYFVSRIITTGLMLVCVIGFVIIKKYGIFKSTVFILLTLYRGLEAFAEVLYGILQKNEQLDKVGKSLFMKSLIGIICFVIIDLITKNLIISILAINVVSLTVMIFYDFRLVKEHLKGKAKKSSVIKIFKSGFYTFAIAFLGLYIINAPKYSIDTYLEENYQTIFGIIVMPATVVSLVAQFLIHPFLNKIVDLYKNKKMKDLQKLTFKLVFAIIIFGIIASFLAYFLGTQVLGFLYGLDLHLYKLNLLLIIIAATMYTMGTIYSSVLTSIRETFSQFIIYIIVSIFALIASNLATKYGGLDGSVLAYLAIMSLQFLLYTIYANIRIAKN